MAILYPSELPLPINSTQIVNETPMSKSIRLAKGSPVVTRWADNNNAAFQVSWVMSQQELRAFMGFYDLVLNKGTEWFVMPVQFYATGQRVTFQNVNFFGNPISVENTGKMRRVSTTLVATNLIRFVAPV